MQRTVFRCLVCLVAILPLAACERGAQTPDDGAPEVATPASAPAADEPAVPGASAPAVTPIEPEAPAASPPIDTPIASSAADVPRMPVTEAATRVRGGEILLVDVRDADSYRADHIEGSVNVPLEEVATRAAELPRDKVIVTYCA
jgi:hypothetical protein